MKLMSLAALAVLFAWPVLAQQNCGPTPIAEAALVMKYGETVVDSHVMDHPKKPGVRVTIQVWANEATGTWTLIGRGPDGLSCLYRSGQNYNGQTVAFFLSEPA